jgi:hypothetical protein
MTEQRYRETDRKGVAGKMTHKKFIINNNKCKICKEMPVKHNGLCRLCAKSLVVVNNMLNHDF